MVTFYVEGYAGWDVWLAWIPEAWAARRVARKLLAGPYKGFDTAKGRLHVLMPHGTYLVTDGAGHVERVPTDGDTLSVARK